MVYLAGFVAAVPEGNREVYTRFAKDASPMFHEFGARRTVECWGADVPKGEHTDFYRAVKAEAGEVVTFAWHEYPDKATSKAADEKMQSDPRMAEMGKDMPFDAARMIYGSFDAVHVAGPGGKMGFVDGALIAVPTARKADYVAYAGQLGPLFLEHGATRVVDAWGDEVPKGEITDFQGAVQAGDDETVAFSWIEWPDRATREAAWPKIMGDPRMHENAVGLDEKRRVWGGFVPILDE